MSKIDEIVSEYFPIDSTNGKRMMYESQFRAVLVRAAEPQWVPVSDISQRPGEKEHIWITGVAYNKRFYAEAVWENGEWLMFDQVADTHCFPCQYPDHWQRIAPPAA